MQSSWEQTCVSGLLYREWTFLFSRHEVMLTRIYHFERSGILVPNDWRKYLPSDSQSERQTLGSIRSKLFSLGSVQAMHSERAQRVPSPLQHTHSPLLGSVHFFPSNIIHRTSGVQTGLLIPILTSLPFLLFKMWQNTPLQKEIIRIILLSQLLSLGSGTSLGFCMTLFKACIPHWDADRQLENTECSLPSERAF